MAFWGIEVKPGKPFTHSFDSIRGRLRISQATLAIGTSTNKSLVQCNVGDKSPVLLCALLPDKTESCQLDLEFEEADEVVFSVIGPRSVHLTGYYVGNCNSRNLKPDDESESYGEDIANTDSEEHNHSSDDDEYDDSFINDDDPEVLTPLPVSDYGDDEVIEIKKPKDRKRVHKHLKKKYQLVESEEETSSGQVNDISSSRAVPIQESESEDDFPISSILNTKSIAKKTTREKAIINIKANAKNNAKEKANVETVENVDKMADDDESKSKKDPQLNLVLPREEVDPVNKTKQKKKQEEKEKETTTNRVLDVHHNSSVPSSKVSPESGTKTKKKRKERSKEEKNHVTDNEDTSENNLKTNKRRKERAHEAKYNNDNSPNQVKENQAKQDESNDVANMNKMDVKNEQDQKPSGGIIDTVSVQSASEKKNKKKRKKNSKILENDENVNVDIPSSPKEENNPSVKQDKNVDLVSSQARTLSNGLIIEDLESGKSRGKIAAPGKKVKIHYTGKLKENGQIIDSNIGKAPFRFRLGDKEIIEGWNLGLDGMHAGDKRRLVIPPTLGYGNQGIGENIPPNSWLVYDIEMVSVH